MLNRMVTLYKKLILQCLYLLLQCFGLLLYPKLMTVRAEGRYQLLKELQRLKNSSSTKNAAANKVTTKYKKHCQIVTITEKKEKNQKIFRNLASTTNISLSTFSLLCLTLTYMLVAFKKGNKIRCVQATRIIKSKDVAKGQILPLVTPNFFQFFKFCFLVISS